MSHSAISRIQRRIAEERPNYGYGLWMAAVWYTIAIAMLSWSPLWMPEILLALDIGDMPDILTKLLPYMIAVSLFGLAVIGGSMAAEMVSLGHRAYLPETLRFTVMAAATAFMTALVTFVPALLVMPLDHAIWAAFVMFGIRLAVDGVASEVWGHLISSIPWLGRYRPSKKPSPEPMNRRDWAVVGGYFVFVATPFYAIVTAIIVSMLWDA